MSVPEPPPLCLLYAPSSRRCVASQNSGNFSRHVADPTKPDDGLFLYFFPMCTLNVYGGGMTCFRTCPTEEPGVSRMVSRVTGAQPSSEKNREVEMSAGIRLLQQLRRREIRGVLQVSRAVRLLGTLARYRNFRPV